jgi:hypothetical protein
VHPFGLNFYDCRGLLTFYHFVIASYINVLGAALIRPFHIEDEAFLPHLITATGVESEIVIKVEP